MLDTSAVFIDGTHIKASANKKKFQKEQVAKAAKVYSGQLRREVNAEREKLGKKPIEDENDNEKDPPRGGGNSQNTIIMQTAYEGMLTNYLSCPYCVSRGNSL